MALLRSSRAASACLQAEAGASIGRWLWEGALPSATHLRRQLAAQPMLEEECASYSADYTAPHRSHAKPTASASTLPKSGSRPAPGPLSRYQAGVTSGTYRPDPRQELTVQLLQDVYADLSKALAAPRHPNRPRSGLTVVSPVDTGTDAGGSWWKGISRMVKGGPGSGAGGGPQLERSGPGSKGLYMYGGVGCGKTMLMDLFVQSCPAAFKVERTHFHDFMLAVHGALRRLEGGGADPLTRVADGIAARTHALALDELFVTDVANAVILNRLFGRLWGRGVVLVATSNRPPDDLYKGGLQRDLFLPFIHNLKTHCRAHDMASGVDYRRLAQHTRGLYFTPSPGHCPEIEVLERFGEVSGGAAPGAVCVQVAMGRTLQVPRAAGRACLFSFQELCGRPVAAADYIGLAGTFHTVALTGVPCFTAANRTEAYRFVTLVDVLYEHRVRLLVSAEASPADLFSHILTHREAEKDALRAAHVDAVVDDNLGFAKDRTISRLTEMQSLEHLLAHARMHAPELRLALEEAAARQAAAAAAS